MPETGLQEEALFILADIIMSGWRFLELLQPSGYGLGLKCARAEMGRALGTQLNFFGLLISCDDVTQVSLSWLCVTFSPKQIKSCSKGTSLAVQWLRFPRLMQRAQVQFLVREQRSQGM